MSCIERDLRVHNSSNPVHNVQIDPLGRRVFSRQDAKRIRKRRTPFRIFLLACGKLEISVDEMKANKLSEIEKIAEEESVNRQTPLRGWAVVEPISAEKDGRSVYRSPTSTNRYHASILLPDSAKHARHIQIRHAKDLAKLVASWQGVSN